MSQRLDDVIAEYVRARTAQGMAANTVRNERRTLDKLLLMLGPVQVRNISEVHLDNLLSQMQGQGLRSSSMNTHLQSLRNFFTFAVRRGYMRANPVEHRRLYRAVPRQRLRVPASKFPALLEAAQHPRDRALVAIGLYLWLRDSEATDLRVGDVNLSDGEVAVRIYKTSQLDIMPISLELDVELRRWLTFYAENIDGPLRPDYYLLPAKNRPTGRHPQKGWIVRGAGGEELRPRSKMTRTSDLIKGVLERCGYRTYDDNGKPTMEGMHTLRRSGARARFDYLIESGYDGAIREVQAGLHHSSVQTTEKYLGIDLDVQRRFQNVKGQRMYGDLVLPGSGNVVSIGGSK